MIRKIKADETDAVMKIWLETNVVAHPFISESYWRSNFEAVKKMLPQSTIFIYEESNMIEGFIGLQGNYIAGLFIDADNQSRGKGTALLDHVRENRSELSLKVYKKNISRSGFINGKASLL